MVLSIIVWICLSESKARKMEKLLGTGQLSVQIKEKKYGVFDCLCVVSLSAHEKSNSIFIFS